jgi:antimicrobial peptide system SdpA family protein
MSVMKVRHLLLPAALVVAGGTYSGLASIDETVLSLPGLDENRANIMAVAPQGWSFFTKSPRDPQVEPFMVTDEGMVSVAGFPNTKIENAMGLSREGRSQGVENALLLAEAQADSWVECSSPSLDACADDLIAAPQVKVENVVPSPSVCGDVVLVQSTPVSWAYRQHTELVRTTQSGIHLDVTC